MTKSGLHVDQVCSYFVLMVEYKKQLSNVAFGGAWSEQLAEDYELKQVMAVLKNAANECGDKDVCDKEFMRALRYVREHIDKGPMLVEGLQKALLEPNQGLRVTSVRRFVKMISEWAGL